MYSILLHQLYVFLSMYQTSVVVETSYRVLLVCSLLTRIEVFLKQTTAVAPSLVSTSKNFINNCIQSIVRTQLFKCGN